MTMADVNAIFGTLLAMGIAFPGMMLALRLMFPGLVNRAQSRVMTSPLKSIGLGLVLAVPVAGLSSVLFAVPAGLMKFLGLVLALGSLGLASCGASALSAGMGSRWKSGSAEELQPLSAHLVGAFALELAAVFPLVGWFIVIPLTLLASLGAAGYALLRPSEGAIPERLAGPAQTLEA
jgi:hypothetical protein